MVVSRPTRSAEVEQLLLRELERLADIFTEYALPYHLGGRTPRPGSETYMDEASYFATDAAATIIVKAFVPDGVALPEANLVLFGTRDLFDESEAVVTQPLRRKSKTTAFMSDFREAMWGVLQQGISSLDVDFVAYAASSFDRLLANAATARFERALREAAGD